MHEDCIYKGNCDDECKNLCIRYSEMKYLLSKSNLPKSQQCFHKMYPDNCDIPAFEKLADIQENIKEFVDNGNNLYLYSSQVGNGKTTWMVKLLLQYFHEVCYGNCHRERGLFINVPTYLMQAKNAITTPDENLENLKSLMMKVDLVVLDDITAVKLSNYDYSTLLGYIDSRLFNGKSTFFTGNYSPDRLEEILGDRLASRVCSGNTIELKGRDMRR